MKYVVYDLDGKIVLWGDCSDPTDHGMGTLLVTDVDATDMTHHVVNDELVVYSDGERDALELPAAREVQRALLKAARDAQILTGFVWDGSRFDADDTSQQRIQGAMLMAMRNPAFSTDWTLFDNSVRHLAASDVLAVGDALAAFVGTNFAKCQLLQAQLAAATTIDEVKSVVWAA